MSGSISLFVYGSFTEGMIHRTQLDKYITESIPGFISGHCYLMPVGYPAVIDAKENTKLQQRPVQIPGELVRLSAPDVILRLMDEFHGVSVIPEKGLHLKKLTQVQTESGVSEANVYFMNPSKIPKGSVLLEQGDWKKSLPEHPSILAQLTERHFEYIKKLGGVKGRSLIPYDLNLSRELMKMDIIVDKGRRLALTKLGKEILRYLPE